LGKNLDITPTESLFLLVLHNQNLSGAEIVTRVKEDLGEDWSPSAGTTYKIIQSLEGKGFIQETTNTQEKKRDKRIRTYSLTKEGRSMVLKVTGRMRKMIGFVQQCCPDGDEEFILLKKSDKDCDC
jgi:DNA-binding PadR family transcriptional regulator